MTSKRCRDGLADIGVYGMGVMGQNLALNIASHGFNVSVCNRAASPTRVDAAVKKAEEEGNLPLSGYKACESFVMSLSKPRKIIILVPAGNAVDQTIDNLSEHMEVRNFLSAEAFNLEDLHLPSEHCGVTDFRNVYSI
jgi:6-phosphogluconate dehydrogenase